MKGIVKRLEEEYDNYIEFLSSLVNVDCGTSNIQGVNEVAAIIAKKFKSLNKEYKVEILPHENCGDRLLITKKGKIPGKIILIGHLDTVFPKGTVEERPFKTDDINAYGPGVEDMKSGIVSMYYALKILDEIHGEDTKTIQILLNSDEEVSSIYSRDLIEENAKDADYALVLESGLIDGTLYTGRKGVGKYKIKTYGKASHAGGNPQDGINAIFELAEKITRFSRLNDYEMGTTVNVGTINGGTAANVIPEYCEALIDIRITKKEEGPIIDKKIRDIALESYVEGTKSVLEGSILRPPMEKTPANMNLFAIAKKLADELGMDLSEKATGGGSDGNFTSNIGIPTLDGLGPAGGGSHGKDEFIQLDTIIPRTALLTALLVELSSLETRF